MSGACAECGGSLPPAAGTGRPRRYCTRACQAQAYRRRRDQGRTAAPGSRARAPRGSSADRGTAMDPDGLVATAVRLADRQGIGGVSLRTVARQAGVGHHTVLRTIGNRDALVAAMVQYVLRSPSAAPSAPAPERPRSATPR